MKPIDAQFEKEARGTGWRDRIIDRQQQRLAQAFREFHRQGGGGSVLHVGVRALDRMPLGIDDADATVHCTLEPGDGNAQRYARSDGRRLSYRDGEFDWVCGDGVLENYSDDARRFAILAEMNRVARKGVFATAGNRRHPLDCHTGLPLLHWLPAALWQRLAGSNARGRRLLTAGELKQMASLLPGRHESDVGHVRLAGPKAHLFLMVLKR